MKASFRRCLLEFTAAAVLLAGASSPARSDEPGFPLLNEWWQWAMSIPAAVNPILDNTGQRCALGQRGNLWFLAGNTGGTSVRECTIPLHTRVLIPLHNTFCFPDADFTAGQCFDAVAQDFSTFTFADAWVDGRSIGGGQVPDANLVEQFPVTGESTFTFAIPKNGLFGFKAGLHRSTVAAGRWAFAGFDTPGQHTLRVRSRSTTGFVLDVTYRLTVVEVN
jgi:hypothetical protein